MEHLDKENREDTCEYIVIGGQGSEVARHPSLIMMSGGGPKHQHQHQHRAFSLEKCPHCECCLRNGVRRSSEEGSLVGGGSSRSGSSLGHSMVVRWDEEDILAWLREAGFDCYQVSSCGKFPLGSL